MTQFKFQICNLTVKPFLLVRYKFLAFNLVPVLVIWWLNFLTLTVGVDDENISSDSAVANDWKEFIGFKLLLENIECWADATKLDEEDWKLGMWA